jgi:hypothetical protein
LKEKANSVGTKACHGTYNDPFFVSVRFYQAPIKVIEKGEGNHGINIVDNYVVPIIVTVVHYLKFFMEFDEIS